MKSIKFYASHILFITFIFGLGACSDGNQGPVTQVTSPDRDSTFTRTPQPKTNPEADLTRDQGDYAECIEEQNCIGIAELQFLGKREDGVISNKGFTFLVMEPTILSRFRFKLDESQLSEDAVDADLRIFMGEGEKLTSSSVSFNKRTRTGTLTLSQNSKTRDSGMTLVIRNVDVCKQIQSNKEIDGKEVHSCTTGEGKAFKSAFYDQIIKIRYVVDDLSVTKIKEDKPGFIDHALSCAGGILGGAIGGVFGDVAGGVVSGIGAAGGGTLDCSKDDDE